MPAWRVDRAFAYRVPAALDASVGPGVLVRVPFGHRRVRGFVVDEPADSAGHVLEQIASVVVPGRLLPPALTQLLGWLARRYVAPRGKVLARVVPPRVRVASAEPSALEPGPAPERLLAYGRGDELRGAIARGRPGTWCLRALPREDRGSLIAELVTACADAGRTALVAVPEVRYGSIVLEELQHHWPDAARVDSAAGDAVRAAGWLRLARGHGLGIGGRNVVLAPAGGVGLVVVDEEHHHSYKEDRSPRYDIRVVARRRAQLESAVCVLVSSSPSLETGALARSGALGSVVPDRRSSKAARPIVETAARPDDRSLSRLLHERIKTSLRQGGRVALLAPARGYARAVWCSACRRSLRCPVCEAGMTLDRSPPRLRCPRCGATGERPRSCPRCNSPELMLMGAGSERLAEQVAAAFPRASVQRADPASAGSPSGARPEPDIYLTTWAGTKETLRPAVDLVGVLDADALIRRPHFRAAERAFQALWEMSEWAGPAAAGGRLVIQTAEPSHHCVQAVIRADYDHFVERELEHRSELGYPPFSELVKVSADAREGAEALGEAASACRSLGAQVLGPIRVTGAASRPDRSERRSEILVKCDDAEVVADALRSILVRAPAASRLRVDVDPR